MIRKILLMTMILAPTLGAAADHNPMFGTDAQNAFSIALGQGTGAGSLWKLVDPTRWTFQPMTVAVAQYSQPMEIMRLPARMNIAVVSNTAYGHDSHLSFWAAGVSWDVALLHGCGFYLGAGLGPYMRDNGDAYVSSRLVFGEKVFIGAQIADAWRAEFFTLHFSNGDFTDVNRGFNFTGLALTYSF